MGLVHSCAARFKGKGVEYDDLFQAGCVGLIKAADGFEADRGFAFSTYAVPVILGEIRRIFRDGGSVKVSRMLKEKSRLALSHKERLTRLNDREPTIEELADALGLDVQETAHILNAAMPAVSLTAHEDGNSGRAGEAGIRKYTALCILHVSRGGGGENRFANGANKLCMHGLWWCFVDRSAFGNCAKCIARAL